MSDQKSKAEAALDALVKVFADAALREVEAKLEAEEKAALKTHVRKVQRYEEI